MAAEVVVAAGVAADQDPGQGAVTGQPPTRLGSQGAGVGVAAQADLALQAVQVHQHQQLGADPTGLGEPPALQGAAGQFGEGVGPALATTAGIVGIGWASQGVQGGQQVWPASGSSSPSTATMLSRVGESHRPRRWWRRSARPAAPSGSASSWR